MKVLLLNPPGDKLYVRSYYCGSTSKANYLFQPLDLLMLSGRLSQEHDIFLLDCIADGLSSEEAIKKIIACQPEVLICVVSIVSWESDAVFLSKLKKKLPNLKVIANGDVFFDEPERLMQDNDSIDAVIFDFISSDVLNYLNRAEENITNMLYRRQGGFVFKKDRDRGNLFSIPIPRHELFLNKNYRFPFAKHHPFATVLTSFGCPFQCSFCIANNLGFKYRQSQEVIEELEYISSLGIKEIFFEDMSFGLPRENILELCNAMIAQGLNFNWTCFSRVDLVDNELLALMKGAGCHTVIFGVESASPEILNTYHKGYTIPQIAAAFRMCRKIGIRTVATFILGLPEETKESCLETIKFAKHLGCDYASFNIAAPRPGTELRKIAIEDSLIKKEDIVFDHSGKMVAMPSRYLSKRELTVLKRKAIINFYLRPGYIFKKLITVKSYAELKERIKMFMALLASSF